MFKIMRIANEYSSPSFYFNDVLISDCIIYVPYYTYYCISGHGSFCMKNKGGGALKVIYLSRWW